MLGLHWSYRLFDSFIQLRWFFPFVSFQHFELSFNFLIKRIFWTFFKLLNLSHHLLLHFHHSLNLWNLELQILLEKNLRTLLTSFSSLHLKSSSVDLIFSELFHHIKIYFPYQYCKIHAWSKWLHYIYGSSQFWSIANHI